MQRACTAGRARDHGACLTFSSNFLHPQVATSDGVLRCYTFGRMDSSVGGPATCVVVPPQPLPPAPAGVVAQDGQAAAAASAEDTAVGTALPDESDFEVG